MNIELRDDSVLISGYVNAVERLSKPIRESIGGKIRTFLERIKAGVFRNALKRNDNVLVLLNHNPERVLANTKDGSAKLEEDNIGLRAEITITDAEVVNKARENKLSGWSFGFHCNADSLSTEGDNEVRDVTDIDLVEVSILDDTKEPAYYGTSIESRGGEEMKLEIRAESIKEINENAWAEHEEIEKNANAEHNAIESKAEEERLELMATKIASKLIELLDIQKIEEPEIETNACGDEEKKRAIDYSSFEERIAKLKQ